MLTLKALDEAMLRLLYAHQMQRDFPAGELKTLSSIMALWHAGVYDVLGAYDSAELIGYALTFRPRQGRVLLLDYLAIEPHVRARGYGTALLAALCAHYASAADVLMIECERPKAAPDEAQARRRIRFYEHAGAQVTSVRVCLYDVEFCILVLGCAGEALMQDWAGEILGLYRAMLSPKDYQRHVRMIRG